MSSVAAELVVDKKEAAQAKIAQQNASDFVLQSGYFTVVGGLMWKLFSGSNTYQKMVVANAAGGPWAAIETAQSVISTFRIDPDTTVGASTKFVICAITGYVVTLKLLQHLARSFNTVPGEAKDDMDVSSSGGSSASSGSDGEQGPVAAVQTPPPEPWSIKNEDGLVLCACCNTGGLPAEFSPCGVRLSQFVGFN